MSSDRTASRFARESGLWLLVAATALLGACSSPVAPAGADQMFADSAVAAPTAPSSLDAARAPTASMPAGLPASDSLEAQLPAASAPARSARESGSDTDIASDVFGETGDPLGTDDGAAGRQADPEDNDGAAADSGGVAGGVASAPVPQASIPQVTFPEASVRDPEAEAADLERRRSVIGLFERLRVEAEHRGGYRRDAVFGGWLYSDGRSTRDRVLAAERRADGTWLSAYDGVSVSAAGELDIDHLVPLAEAWESGGHAWSADTWLRFGNDLGDPRSLIAVSASTNRSKGAADPQDWWPPLAEYRCQYAADWVAVKSRWDLAMDAAEQRSLNARLEGCSGAELEFAAPAIAAVVIVSTPAADGGASPGSGAGVDNSGEDCHPAYEPCLPNLSGDALNCGDLTAAQKPVRVKVIGEDPYRLDRDRDGRGCQS